jgi:hypothetical protein
MKDLEDLDLKAEIDEIMRSVDSIMKKIEAVMPPKPEPAEGVRE